MPPLQYNMNLTKFWLIPLVFSCYFLKNMLLYFLSNLKTSTTRLNKENEEMLDVLIDTLIDRN